MVARGGKQLSEKTIPFPDVRGAGFGVSDAAKETDMRIETPIPALSDDQEARTQALLESLEERILVLDGATGTGLQDADLTAEDFGGAELDGCNENLSLTRPDVVCDCIGLPGGGRRHRRDQHLWRHAAGPRRVRSRGRRLRDQPSRGRAGAAGLRPFDEPGRPRFVCGSMGPTTKAISVTGGVTFEELQEHYRVQALGLMAGGADYLLLETCQDTRNIKAGVLAIERAFDEAGWRLPVAVSVTIEPTGTMLAGQDAEALAISLAHLDLLYLGLNCATGPELMAEPLRTLSELAPTRIACVPNAGLPDEDGLYTEGPEVFRRGLRPLSRRRLAQSRRWLLRHHRGACRGLAELVEGRRPRPIPHHQRSLISGIEGSS